MSMHRPAMAAAFVVIAASIPAAGQTPDVAGFDPATVTTVSGTIVRVALVARRGADPGGINLLLRTKRETLPVNLGPVWNLDELWINLKRGERITVRGSRISVGGRPAIIAAAVSVGPTTVTLRDSTGSPAWARAETLLARGG
ncbi:MAG TPA: hypothetical protein VFT96_04660 [Gemmatimonadaceae bacterium]|nr:hypothetical protein [Gemmatimonadaceae bacterium]